MEGEEENRPYRRLTFEWYKDLETGTFLLKLVAEGEGVKGGRREATFTLSADAIDMTKSVTLEDIVNMAADENADESLLANKIAVTLAKLFTINGENNIDVAIDAFIDTISLDARELMALDATKLKMALSGEKS
ncbi:MAG: hypothetical protein RXO54_06415 [Acidilobus sp.]